MTKTIDGNDLTDELFAIINRDNMPTQLRADAIKHLFEASEKLRHNGNPKICINMLAYSVHNNYLFTPLGLAIYKDSSCIEQLLEMIVALPLKQEEKSELLAGAILHCFIHRDLDRKERFTTLLKLTQHNFSLNACVKLYLNDKNQIVTTSPLRYAVLKSTVEVVHELLKHGANPKFDEKPNCALEAAENAHERISSSLYACYYLNKSLDALLDNNNERDNNYLDANLNITKALRADAAFAIEYLAILLNKSLQQAEQNNEILKFACLLSILKMMASILHLGGDTMMQECLDFHKFCILPFAQMKQAPSAFGGDLEMKRFFEEPVVAALSESFYRALELSNSNETQMAITSAVSSVIPNSFFYANKQQQRIGQINNRRLPGLGSFNE